MSKGEVIIGITDCESFKNYERWFASSPGVTVLRLSWKEKNYNDLSRCHGLVLSGGEDIHPSYYNRPEYVQLCHEINPGRDEFEWRLLEESEKNKTPLFGVCRGLQVANVFFGGTLIPDIPAFGRLNHSRFPGRDRYHSVTVDENSFLCSITATNAGAVNSSHHQSAERIGKGLVVNCFSPDGIVEGIERKDPHGQPFLLLVQWHPERMEDLTSPLSRKIKESFIAAAAAGV